MMRWIKIVSFYIILLVSAVFVKAQQSHSLFLIHYLPESNLTNPAVPITCKWYIGLPVLSSVHLNYGNSGFSYNDAFVSSGEGGYQADVDNLVKGLGNRNYVGTEFHTQLFALGHRRGDYSFMFTLTEKNNLPVFYTKEAIQLAWDGNRQFEGQQAGFKGSGLYFTHYREYALSVSKTNSSGVYYGLRAKVLFGKLNAATSSTDINLYTDENTFNLEFSGDLKVHTSLPLIVETENGVLSNVIYDESVSAMDLVLNRKNPGFAIDAGIIYPYSDKVELSAAILDLGFMRWGSNLNTITGDGDFNYEGPLGDSINSDNYFDELRAAFMDSMQVVATPDKYTILLSTRAIAGANYTINDKLKAGVQGELLAYRNKIMPSLTLSTNYNVFGNTFLMASYTIQYNTLRNFGFGFVLGRNPVQFYMISDNAAGFIWPMSTRNVNLRFGLNINLGCSLREKGNSGKGALKGNCYYLEQSNKKAYQKLKKKKRK